MPEKMYQGIPFSPQAALSGNIGEGDTIIPVTDVSLFPEAPNYATIGTDEDGETILYAAKTDGALSGCIRGVEGTAKAWRAGETIARNFTYMDLEALQRNIRELNATTEELGENISQLLVVGEQEPETGPALWIDTSGREGGGA